MGLDMYFFKKTYVKNWKHDSRRKHEVTVKLNGEKHPTIQPKKVTYIQEEVGYWRKANHIHNWFVQNCQNGVDECQEAFVDPSKMLELLDICIQIRDADNKVATAEELLPPQSGFFFGGTDIDEYYMEDINATIKIMEDELALIKKHERDENITLADYYYHSSW